MGVGPRLASSGAISGGSPGRLGGGPGDLGGSGRESGLGPPVPLEAKAARPSTVARWGFPLVKLFSSA